MLHEYVAIALSPQQQAVLIAHVDGPVLVVDHGSADSRTKAALISRELLRPCLPNGEVGNVTRPQATTLTEDGRWVLAWVLAGYADKLVAAGMLDLEAFPTGALADRVNLALTEMRDRRVHETEPA